MKTTMQRTRTALALLCALLLLGGAAVALATGADTIVFTDAALEKLADEICAGII